MFYNSASKRRAKTSAHSKMHFEEYLESVGEPRDDNSGDSAASVKADLIKNRYLMKRRVRLLAQKMRSNYT